MLNEIDFSVFPNEEERDFFREVLQTYYSKNYRSSVVMLHSLVVLDLYEKLQLLVQEGSKVADVFWKKTKEKLNDPDTPYSSIEKSIVNFFINNYSSYFKGFSDDINYLICLRGKCAHLKVDDQMVFVPKEYQVRMVIISMYNNIFSREVPFIANLYNNIRGELKEYSSKVSLYEIISGKSELIEFHKKRYYKRMTPDALLKSYRSFFKLAYISENIDDKVCFIGLFLFLYGMTVFLCEKGDFSVFEDSIILGHIQNCKAEIENYQQSYGLFHLLLISPVLRDIFRKKNQKVFFSVVDYYLYSNTKTFVDNVRTVFPDSDLKELVFGNQRKRISSINFSVLYELFKNELNINEYCILSLNCVPDVNGFDIADSYMAFFLDHFLELSDNCCNTVFMRYCENRQFYSRRNSENDIKRIKDLNKNREFPLDLNELKTLCL